MNVFHFIAIASTALLITSCRKDVPGEKTEYEQGKNDIVIDLDFFNSENMNPLGFGEKQSEDENADGDEYFISLDTLSLPFVVSKGSQSGARYQYKEFSLVYPEGTSGKCLFFEKAYGWIKTPAIKGYVLQCIIYEHGNGYPKQMVVKESLSPSVSIACTSDNNYQIATSSGPNSETVTFYSNAFIDEKIFANPRENTSYYLQFISASTRVYRIKLIYKSQLPQVPDFPEDVSLFPKVRITTEDKLPIISKEVYVFGTMSYDDADGLNPGVHSFSQDSIKIKGRGNTTWKRPKKPYRVKLDRKASFFGLEKDKDWCLIANYCDKSQLRNIVAMRLSEILGFDWTPAMYPVELWLNGSYQGLYYLSEHKKVSPKRINISTPDSGGRDMYLETDLLMDETTCFKSGMGIPVMFCNPEVPDEAMLLETQQWFSDFESSLSSSSFPDSGYENYIDVPSFINHYIIQELSKNVDGRMTKGAYMTRTIGGPIRICHEWDFDLAFGNANTIRTLGGGADNGPTGFLIKDFTGADIGVGWYPVLFTDPNFIRQVQTRWNQVYPELCTIPDFIDRQASKLGDAPDRNFARWPILGKYIWPNTSWPATFAEEVRNLKDFYTERLGWLNENINKLSASE